MWILAGDKVDTAVAISESCGLCDAATVSKVYVTERELNACAGPVRDRAGAH